MATLICVSVSEAQALGLLEDGPRRDFLEMAKAVDGRMLYASTTRGKGLLGRVLGPHVRQALRASKEVRPGDTCFTDGEHVALPLLFLLWVRRKHSVKVVSLAHFVDRWWKLQLIRMCSRLVPRATLVVHSAAQFAVARKAASRSWNVVLVPYQVDTDFWRADRGSSRCSTILAVGSENRDYDTLIRAVEELPATVIIAAGSHWARHPARIESPNSKVRYLENPLPFAALRDHYREAAIVVVPLHDVTNQSGVTVILEAMSMGKAVVVTATRGQQECIEGPLTRGDGTVSRTATSERGPGFFGDVTVGDPTGAYVSPGDVLSLRAALTRLLDDPSLCEEMGMAAREAAVRHFTLERYVSTMAALMGSGESPNGAIAGSPR